MFMLYDGPQFLLGHETGINVKKTLQNIQSIWVIKDKLSWKTATIRTNLCLELIQENNLSEFKITRFSAVWIYNYLCYQCLSSLTLWVQIPLRWYVLDTLCDKVCQWLAAGRWSSLGTPASSTKNWLPRYNWNIVEGGVKHHKPKPKQNCIGMVWSLF